MARRKEQEYLLQEAWRRQLLRGEIDRRQLLSRALVAGLGMAGVSVAARFGARTALAQRPLTPTFYQWIEDLHPSIPQVNAAFPGINYQIAPVEGFGIERFVAEAKSGESTWDVYVGMTPFVEMTAMIEADVIEPWDNYIPKEVIDDMIPSIREECTVDGKLYSWPFLLDVIGMGWHSGLSTQAGLPDAPPATWDEYLQNAQTIVDSGAAPFGATFDAHGWRSLAPDDPQHEQRRLHLRGPVRFHQRSGGRSADADEEDHGAVASGHPSGRRDRRRRQRHPGRGRLRGPAGRLLHQVFQRAAAHGPVLGRPDPAASSLASPSSPMARARPCSGPRARVS